MPPFSLSPSLIARFFFHDCERYLRYQTTPKVQRRKAGVPEIAWDTSPVTAAILERGYRWEEKALRQYLPGKVRIASGKRQITERVHDIASTLKHLAQLQADEAIYQPTIKVPPSFQQRYGLSPELCDFPPCRPDLLQATERNGQLSLRVIDLKASAVAKMSHRIQAAIYALMLREIASAAKLPLTVDTEEGGIWLIEQPKPEWCDLGPSVAMVERFLSDQLLDILTRPIAELHWHLFYRCEWCEFYEACRQEAEQLRSFSLLPYLTPGGKRFLCDTGSANGRPLVSLADLADYLTQPGIDKTLDCCGSLRAKGDRLRKMVQALLQGAVIAHGGSSLALPINENVAVLLTLQEDPVTGKIYAAGFRRLKGKDVYDTGVREEIFLAAHPDDDHTVRRGFLQALYDELEVLHDYNEEREWREQKSLQTYVYDSYELTLFNRLLRESLDDPDLAEMALHLLFYFQDTTLAEAEEHPEAEIPFPVVVLTSVLQQLLALPVPVFFRLPEVCATLPSPSFPFTIEPSDLFWFKLSNTLKSDAIFLAWDKDRQDALTWIHDELLRRLRATAAVLDGLRHQVKDSLFAWPPKFLFPDTWDFKHPELSRLAFITRYESFMGALQTRQSRSLPWSERKSAGISIPLRYQGGNRWQVLSSLDSSVLEKSGDFFSFILVPEGEAGERAQMGYNDYAHRSRLWAPYQGLVRLARLSQEPEIDSHTGLITAVFLEIKKNRAQPPFQAGERAVLHPRYTDFTADRIIDRLGALDVATRPDFIRLLRQPRQFAQSRSLFQDISSRAIRVAQKTAGFTSAQMAAFQQLLSSRLTLVWGPPGTGKTHFLAKAILSLAKTRKTKGLGLQVAVAAFTHAAIENILAEVQEQVALFGLKEGLSLYKLKYVSTPRGQGLEVVEERALSDVMQEDLLVVGGTVYSFAKADVGSLFPLLIIDEASQMKIGEFALALSPLASGGHIVLAGDDLQLPPIINGVYPDPADGLPGLHESIFAYLRARDAEQQPYTHKLQENWRMNTTLSRFPAETLYGLDYRPATPEIGRQRLALRQPLTADQPLGWLLDPAYPLAVVILEDVRAALENIYEAELVAEMAAYLRDHLGQPGTNRPYPNNEEGDRLFWHRGLFIVSPHHAQIRAIKNELAKRRRWHSPAFVDTVDKMQGQQTQCVIVSYGVSDVESALAEAEFIYSLNRLNVSVSRARAKCIVFLPRPLLTPSFAVLEQDKAIQGLAHMNALIAFCQSHGETQQFTKTRAHGHGQVNLTAYRVCFP